MVEILVAVAILAILIAIVAKYSSGWLNRAEALHCAQNLRSLQVSFASYVQDEGHWPQEPEELREAESFNPSEDWWLQEMENYGATPEVWQCPTIKRLVSDKDPDGRPKIHYTPTPFDEQAYTPYRWSTQPWLIEIGNMHGNGALICFPDGSIKAMGEVVQTK